METKNGTRYKSLVVEGTKYKTFTNDKFKKRIKWEKPNDKKLVSFIPGTIIKVYVKNGQKVKEGDKLVVIESMKMLNQIRISKQGIIKNVKVKVGQKVTKGELMIELE